MDVSPDPPADQNSRGKAGSIVKRILLSLGSFLIAVAFIALMGWRLTKGEVKKVGREKRPPPTRQGRAPTDPATLIREADDLFVLGDYVGALGRYTQASKAAPLNGDASRRQVMCKAACVITDAEDYVDRDHEHTLEGVTDTEREVLATPEGDLPSDEFRRRRTGILKELALRKAKLPPK